MTDNSKTRHVIELGPEDVAIIWRVEQDLAHPQLIMPRASYLGVNTDQNQRDTASLAFGIYQRSRLDSNWRTEIVNWLQTEEGAAALEKARYIIN